MQDTSGDMPTSTPSSSSRPSLPCDPAILEALRQATHKSQVRLLFQRHDENEINQAWHCLDPIDRSTLLLCKNFDGTIVPEFNQSDL
jgi:hypothetical protein